MTTYAIHACTPHCLRLPLHCQPMVTNLLSPFRLVEATEKSFVSVSTTRTDALNYFDTSSGVEMTTPWDKFFSAPSSVPPPSVDYGTKQVGRIAGCITRRCVWTGSKTSWFRKTPMMKERMQLQWTERFKPWLHQHLAKACPDRLVRGTAGEKMPTYIYAKSRFWYFARYTFTCAHSCMYIRWGK